MIEHEIDATGDAVSLWLSSRLPYEPRGALRVVRDKLRKAIIGLKLTSGARLVAEYSSLSSDFFDVENVLLYNVGTGVFSNASRHGVHVRRHYARPRVSPSGRSFEHQQRYSFEPVDLSPSERPTATFSLRRVTSGTKPHDVWWALCSGKAAEGPPLTGHFRLDIDLPTPGQNIAAAVKPLLDGVICGMHPAVDVGDDAVARLAAKMGWSPADIRRHLADPLLPLLAPRRVLRAYRNFIKWDPADELCDEFVVRPIQQGGSVRLWVSEGNA